MGITFDFNEIDSILSKMTKKSKNELTDKVLDAGKIPVIKAMVNNVPVDTGELLASLGEIKKTGSGVDRKIELGSTSKDRKVVERAYYQEHGNSSMMGKKWMKKSFQDSKNDAIKEIEKCIIETIF